MGSMHLLFLFLTLSLSIFTTTTNAHNITALLSGFPDYSLFNSYLSQTKLDGEINSRQTLTVLVLNNAAMSALAAKHPLSVIKNALRLHVLLDYYDAAKLHQLTDGTTTTTTLYQTTGNAAGNIGSVNITDLKGGKVGFGSAVPGSTLDSTYTKEVKKVPYNISILEISQPIIAPGVLTAPAPSASDLNITALLEKAGCKTFAALILKTGVLKVYQTAADKGLTVFAPSDEAFKAANVPDLSKLSNADLVSLLQFHALSSYAPIGTLKTTKDPFTTLATSAAGKFDLTAETSGDEVTLKTGYDSSRVATTVLDSTPLCIFTVDSVLLPPELFGMSPSPAPGPVSVTSPTPSPNKAPTPAEAPASVMSPPAPPMESPVVSPAEGPIKAENSSSDSSAAVYVESPALLKAIVTVSAIVIVSVFLS